MYSINFIISLNLQGGCMVSMMIMLGMRHDHVALYFGTCFFGLFISSITPTALSLAEQYIDVTCQYFIVSCTYVYSIMIILAAVHISFPPD